MNLYIRKKRLMPLCAGAVLGMELLLLADAVAVLLGRLIPDIGFAVLWVVLTIGAAALLHWKTKRILAMACILPMVLAAVLSCGYLGWRSFSSNAGYEFPDAGKNQIFGGRKVMVVVPHQDDDLNILGGAIEEYARYGSEIYAVYVTNGDYVEWTETRYREALAVFDSLGVSADHVIFLGYGDSWQEGGPHIYNAEPGTVMTSHIGRTETYGTRLHPAYREGRAYTIDNLQEDLKGVILEYRPEVIFCSDYDHHIDHKFTTLLFDKVMGQLLKENPDYTPVVYKAYAYGTAWEAEPDYYADNILSTQDPFAEPYSQKPAVYRWEDRIRFPVNGAGLSRSLVGSDSYRLLSLYESQGAQVMAAAAINGDKVAWQRHTISQCLHGQITASSGNAELLNDFMLIENDDLVDESRLPYDGVWIPDPQDEEKKVSVTLKEAADLVQIVLYDHPSEEHNVLNAVIAFADGAVLETGPLDPGGAATVISVDRSAVSSFEIMLKETEGALAGLTEIEAFSQTPGQDGRFIKLTDGNGNFLYDFCTAPDGHAELSLYVHGDLPELTEEAYHLGISGGTGSAVLVNGVIRVSCPPGEGFALNITCDAAGVSDTVYVRNPGALARLWSDFWQNVEKTVFLRYSAGGHKELFLSRLWNKAFYVMRKIR